ncbi:MAG: DUF2141 domain-containing protein [Myxococcota bacterium]|jgi:uncharacterized protein (DUF2141 family)|nr:DUF2141 domain-containing protein [Myxococcota bacterium]
MKKRTPLSILALAVAAVSVAAVAAAQAGRISVTLTQIEGDEGTILCGLFRQSDADGFPMGRSSAWKRLDRPASAVRDGRTTLTFDEVPAGRYAVSCMHDEDGNGEMRTGAFGIPKEGWGVSRNVSPTMRAPRFEEAVVDFDGSQTSLRIRMQY